MFETKTIIYYSRYVDDILIILDFTVTSEEYIMNLIKKSFILTYNSHLHGEKNNCTNCLDSCFVKKKRQTRNLHTQKANKHRYRHTQHNKINI